MSVYRVRSVLLLRANFLSVYEVVCICSRWAHHVRRQHAIALGAHLVLVERHGHLGSASSRTGYTADHSHANCMMIIVHVKDLLLLRGQVRGHLASGTVRCSPMIHVGEPHCSRHEYVVVLALRARGLPVTHALRIVLTTLRHAGASTVWRLDGRRLHEVVVVLRDTRLLKVLILLVLLSVLIAVVCHVASVAADGALLVVAVQVLDVQAASALMVAEAVTTRSSIECIILASCTTLRVQMLA